jgi:hypothetical protein
MTMYNYPNGIGESTGDILVTGQQLFGSGQVWYVSSVSGTDAASPQGLDKGSPLATLSYAYNSASAGDIIVLLAEHTETFTSHLTINKAELTIVGAGSSAGVPTVTLYNNGGSDESLLNITANGVSIRNIKFPANVQTTSGHKVVIAAANCHMSGCYFEGNEYDASAAQVQLTSAAWYVRIDTTTFVSTSTSAASGSRPFAAIYVYGGAGGPIDYPFFKQVVFDNGTVGWQNTSGANAAFVDAGGMNYARFEEISLLHGADLYLSALSGSGKFYANIETTTGGGRIRGPS